ncbi:MAG: histidine phosphatase family protein [Candidatus Rokubacteria bacterium]|nr:histidine phosphatase family protein [Candidatus Rokubacteria bacterium]
MLLILIRHADAANDELRALTDAGREQHSHVSRALNRMGIAIDRLLSSPLLRARQTAEITAAALGFGGAIEETPALGDDFSVDALLERVAALPAEATVACVGHEPHLGRFAGALLTPDGNLAIGVKKSGVVGIQCEDLPARGNGTLLFAFRPEELLRLVEDR